MIEQLMRIVTLLTLIQNGQAVGTASGFFYVRGDRLFLITNHHVVLDEAKNHRPTELQIKVHSGPGDLTKNVSVTVPLYHNGKPTWREHRCAGWMLSQFRSTPTR